MRPEDNKIPIMILNVRDENVVIKNFQPKLVNLDLYQMAFSDINYSSVNRVEEVLQFIKMNDLNKEEKNAVEYIVAKFADIFHLPSDPLTVTNVYKHKIQLKTMLRQLS